MIGRLFITLFSGVLLASIVHLTIILLIPHYSQNLAWAQIKNARLPLLQFTNIGSSSAKIDLMTDPQFETALCPYNLSNGAVSVSSMKIDSFWSLAIYNEDSHHIYSLNDRSISDGKLNLLIVNEAQKARFQNTDSLEQNQPIILEQNDTNGFIVFRLFIPDDIQRDGLKAMLSSLQCKIFIFS